MSCKENRTESSIFVARLRNASPARATHMLNVADILRGSKDIATLDMHYVLDGLFLKFKYLPDGKTYQLTIKQAGNASPFTGDAA